MRSPKPVRTGMGTWETQDILFMRVDTDAGITGWGEAFSNASIPVTIPAISEIVAKLASGMARPVVHTAELLDWATGGPAPPRLADIVPR